MKTLKQIEKKILNGFVIIRVYKEDGELQIHDDDNAPYFENKKDAMDKYYSDKDDKWDLDDRCDFHWYLYSMKTKKLTKLPGWKNPYDSKRGYNQLS